MMQRSLRDVPLARVPSGTVLLLCVAAACSGPRTTLHEGGEVIHVQLAGLPFADVHYQALPKPFVYPLLGPGGESMTRGYPMAEVEGEARDHPHHQSFWFAHGDVNGLDFWHGTEHDERIVLRGEPRLESDAESGRVTAEYDWLADEKRLLCTETRVLRFHGTDAARFVDVDIRLRAGESPLVLGDTKEGTFALRLHPALRVTGEHATGRLLNSAGDRDAQAWGRRARWLDDSGTIDGREVGVTIFDHPENPGHPTWWHARTYGLIAANPFGVHDFEKRPAGSGDVTVSPDGELRFRYRVLLHADGWDAVRLDAAWQAWTDSER